MKSKDLLFISHLRENSRKTLTQISKKTNIPVSTLFDRLNALKGKIITKHTCLLDFAKLGYETKTKILIKVPREQREDLQQHLIRCQNANSVYKVNNGYDYMIEGIFRNLKEVEDFIERIEEKFNVQDSKIYYLLTDLKLEGFMANPSTVGLIS